MLQITMHEYQTVVPLERSCEDLQQRHLVVEQDPTLKRKAHYHQVSLQHELSVGLVPTGATTDELPPGIPATPSSPWGSRIASNN